MSPVLILSICVVISLGFFIYGLSVIIKEKAPLYFKLLTVGIGCYVLQDIHTLVHVILGNTADSTPAANVTVIVCFVFFIIANQGEVDKFVDEGGHRKEKRIAFIPAVIIVCFFSYFMIKNIAILPIMDFIATSLVCVSGAIASYYALKHLLLPLDEMGFLKSTRGINLAMLIFIILQFGYTPLFFALPAPIVAYYYLPMSASAAFFSFSCARGAKIWKSTI